jgi:hypothetical protein
MRRFVKHFSKAAAIAIAIGSIAQAEEPTTADLMQQIKALQDKVQQLEQRQDASSHTRDIDQITREVLADADQRSHLLDSEGFTAGYNDGKFILQSADGNFVLHPYAWFQFRNVTNYRQDVGASDDNDLQNGFEMRRAKFGFDGNVFSPNLSYYFKWATDRKSGNVGLEEAWARFRLSDLLAIKAGQMKGPFAHDSYMTVRKSFAVERTLLVDDFVGATDYLQGVDFQFNDDIKLSPVRASVAITDGSKNNSNQNFQDFPTNNADWGAEARVEYFAMGNPKQYEDYSAMGNKNDLLVIGGGLSYTEAGNTNYFLQTVDAQYENTRGLGISGAVFGRESSNAPQGVAPTVTTEHDLFDWGFFAQAGYMIVPKWEPFVRYSYINYDSDGLAADAENHVHEITVGVNYYLHGYGAKLTLDADWLPSGSPMNDDGAGILANNGGSEFIVRAQLQLAI